MIIIGSGIAGIATSIRLAKKGYRVTVFEANPYPGGKLSAFELGNYRFDAGPSLLTMPQYIEALFELCGEDPHHHFTYSQKKVGCHYFWEDGTALKAFENKERFFKEVHQTLGVHPQVLASYLKKAKKKFDLTQSIFLNKTLHKIKSFLNRETLNALLHIRSLEIGKSLNAVNEEQLKEPHLVQLYNRFATYNGSNPYQTPGIMSLVQHLESHYGTFVPTKGMVSITNSLVELAKRQGVDFRFNEKVDEIVVENKTVRAVLTKQGSYTTDYVCSNMDVYPTYNYLLPHEKPPRTIDQERSSSAVIFYWGIETTFDALDLHNIFFSEDYKKEFETLFNLKTVSDDPTVYVNITAKDIPEDAPEGCENWFVMVNTPPDTGQDWETLVKHIRACILKKLNRMLKVNLQDFIVQEQVLSPPEIEKKTHSYQGALYGTASNDKFAAFLRHPNFSQQIKQLYFCGGSVHPGGGIPLCLLSAKIVADQLPQLNTEE